MEQVIIKNKVGIIVKVSTKNKWGNYYVTIQHLDGGYLKLRSDANLSNFINSKIYYEIVNTKGRGYTNSKLGNFKLNEDIMKKTINYLKSYSIDRLLYIDIETVSGEARLLKKNERLFDEWSYKKRNEELSINDLKRSYQSDSPLFAEFGKIACISIGYEKEGKLRIKSFIGEEKDLLSEFNEMISLPVFGNFELCGHAIKGFDIPFLTKRMLINGIIPADKIDLFGIKPWEMSFLDTMEIWRGLSYYNTSLTNLCYAFGIDTPKSNMNGSEVSENYYKGKIEEIREYCEGDVNAVYQIMKKLIKDEV